MVVMLEEVNRRAQVLQRRADLALARAQLDTRILAPSTAR